MSKPVIAVDIDDVLVPHYQGLIDWYNQTYGTHLTLASNGDLDPKPWGTDIAAVAIQRVHGYFETAAFRNEKPFEAAVSAIEQLSKNYTIVAITARDLMLEGLTTKWLATHFKDLIQQVRFTAKYSLEAKSESKTDVCLELGATFLIDDSLSTAIKLSRAGIQVILFGDYPWNQAADLPNGVTRCVNWDAVLNHFNQQTANN